MICVRHNKNLGSALKCPDCEQERAVEQERYERICPYMDKMNVEVARRWCEPGVSGCACLGCANNFGGLVARGFTKTDWQDWWKRQAEDK